ncbi:MAG: hypothetical protein AB7S55_05695 [Thiomonas sp.]
MHPSQSASLPASVRKQILIARMAVERVEFAQAVEQFRQHARPGSLVRQLVAGALPAASKPADALWRAWSYSRRHPYVGSLLGSALSLLLRKRLTGSGLARLFKLGAAAAVAYAALRFWRGDGTQN